MDKHKEKELKRNKGRALALLLVATAVFGVTAFLPSGLGVNWIKAIAEAAMVGALADWFAVVALFRKVPIPFVSRHTAIIPSHKDEIADNLAVFVREKFLDPDSIVALIRKHDPAQQVAEWLTSPANTDRLGAYAVKMLSGILEVMEDARIQGFIRDAIHAAIDKVDLSKSSGAILDSLTRNGRHQELLDEGILQLLKLLQEPGTHSFISTRIIEWLKSEHPVKEKVLPSEWIGNNGSEMISNAIRSLLDQIGKDPGHALRRNFDEAVASLIGRLKRDPAFLQKGEEIKQFVKNDEMLNAYTSELWGELRNWLRRDLDSSDSLLRGKVAASGQWMGKTLAQDPGLRSSLNGHMQEAARNMAPDFAQFLTRHISDTVRNWDAREMAHVIELNIGKDLQLIRINGTIVGGLIGCGLYLVSHLGEIVRAMAH